jgi:hypothetical protein
LGRKKYAESRCCNPRGYETEIPHQLAGVLQARQIADLGQHRHCRNQIYPDVKRVLKHGLGGALCCVLCLAGSCGKAAETISAGMIGAPNAPSWPWYIAIEKGLLAQAGITLDIIYVPTASGLVQQLAAGSLDIVAGTDTQPAPHQTQGPCR